MKVALINLTSTVVRGGVETAFWHLAQGLAERRHIVDLLAGRGPIQPSEAETSLHVYRYPYIPRRFFFFFGTRMRKMLERLSMVPWWLPRALVRGYDFIVVGKPFDIPAALFVRAVRGTRICFYSGGGEFFPGFDRLSSAVDVFAVCSNAERDDVERRYGVYADVVHLAIDPAFTQREPQASWAETCGIRGDEFVFITGARLAPMKGHDVALRALARIISEVKQPVRYLIAGDGQERSVLEKLTHKLNLSEQVRFLGSRTQEELVQLYALADVALFPSQFEAFGIAVSEAMACGVATIGSMVGGIPEQIVDGCGMLVPPDEPDQLADAMLRMIRDPELRERIAQAGRKRVSNHFTLPRYIDAFELLMFGRLSQSEKHTGYIESTSRFSN